MTTGGVFQGFGAYDAFLCIVLLGSIGPCRNLFRFNVIHVNYIGKQVARYRQRLPRNEENHVLNLQATGTQGGGT